VEVASLPTDRTPQAASGVRLSSDAALDVVRDIYYMKLMAVEVVSQLALDTIASVPKDSRLFSHLLEQIQQEFDHLNGCRSLLADRDAFAVKPVYVRHYARMMRSCGGKRRRTLPLAVAVILCIAVERSAMQQLARTTVADRELSDLLRKLGAEEEDHYKLVAQVVAPCAASKASLLERTRVYAVIGRITLITLLRWWPRQVQTYRACGLNVGLFLEDVLQYAAAALRPLGVFFPRRLLLRLARIILRVS
jgi:hypothetical protein